MSNKTIDLRLSRWQMALALYFAGVGILYHVAFATVLVLQWLTRR